MNASPIPTNLACIQPPYFRPSIMESAANGNNPISELAVPATLPPRRTLRLPLGPESHDRRAPAARLGGRVAKRLDERRPGENGPHHLPLHTNPTAMNDTEIAEPECVRFLEICLHDPLHIFRRDHVEIKYVGDGNANGLV